MKIDDVGDFMRNLHEIGARAAQRMLAENLGAAGNRSAADSSNSDPLRNDRPQVYPTSTPTHEAQS